MPTTKSALPPPPYTYDARLIRVVDGDTILATVSLGFGATLDMRLRFAAINCPEAGTPEGDKATAFTQAWFAAHADDMPFPLRITTTKDRQDPYGRYLARIARRSDGAVVNDDLLASGNAAPYPAVAPKGATP